MEFYTIFLNFIKNSLCVYMDKDLHCKYIYNVNIINIISLMKVFGYGMLELENV